MPNLKFTRKSIVIIAGLILVIFLINSIVSSKITNKISEILLKNDSKYYTAQIESTQFKLIRGSLYLNNITLIPKEVALDSLIKNDLKKQALDSVSISSVGFNGISFIDLLFSDKINVSNLEINGLHVKNFKNDEIKKISKEKKALNLDSIYIKKLKGFRINKIKVNDFIYESVNVNSNETTFKNEPLSFESSGFKLEEQDSHVFKLLPVKDSFEIEKIELNVNTIKYDILVDKLGFNFNKNLITINKLSLKPQIPKRKLALSYTFSKDVFDVELDALNIYNFRLDKLLNKEGIFIDSLAISGLDMELYKDKRRPFNEDKNKSLPHISLQNMKTPLEVKKVKIANSEVLIEEHTVNRDTIMILSFDKVNASILNITSVNREHPMSLELDARLMKKAPLKINADFSLKNQGFNFNGNLGTAKLKLFDSALFPAIGLKVLNGNLDSMTFVASANNHESNGSMTMLYHNLEATVFKAGTFEKNKFLSWSVNSVIKKSNPNKKGKTRVSVMSFKRDTYKGLGNYIWKTLLSGITNSMAPGGKQVKSSRH